MAFNEENGNGFYMPVAPAYNNGGGGFGFGGDWGWIILLLLAFNGGFGGYGQGAGGLYPWMNQADITTSGFQNAATNSAISSLQNSVTAGFGDVQAALCNGFAQAEIAENGRQMANMNQLFGIQSALQTCCCENRAATADLKYTVATEACADRAAITSALRDVLEANSASTQRILDTLCQDKIDAKNEKIADLQRQLTMANLAASQTAQTAKILADNTAQTYTLEQYLAPTPRPAYIVQNPNCCTNNNTCGCGF